MNIRCPLPIMCALWLFILVLNLQICIAHFLQITWKSSEIYWASSLLVWKKSVFFTNGNCSRLAMDGTTILVRCHIMNLSPNSFEDPEPVNKIYWSLIFKWITVRFGTRMAAWLVIVLVTETEIILGNGVANERRRYLVTSSLIGYAITQSMVAANERWCYKVNIFSHSLRPYEWSLVNKHHHHDQRSAFVDELMWLEPMKV